MLALIDYGAGNLQSVINALKYIGCEAKITSSPNELLKADAAILPGVGSFGEAARNLKESGFSDEIARFIESGRPFLGICLGLQLLFPGSEESEGVKGLSVYEGEVAHFPDCGLKVPHIGWNSLNIKQKSGIFKGIEDQAFVYFVHSYYLKVKDRGLCAASCNYGIEFDAAIQKDNAAAVQFHPEKSGEVGMRILKNFVSTIY